MTDATEDHCTTTTITDSFLDTYDNQLQNASINDRQDPQEFQLRNNLDVHSYDSIIPPLIMTKSHESREQLDAFNPNFHLPPINLENAYKFASLLFSPPQLSIEPTTQPSEPATSPDLSEYHRSGHRNSKNERTSLGGNRRVKTKTKIR
jgi:hypothetical protein